MSARLKGPQGLGTRLVYKYFSGCLHRPYALYPLKTDSIAASTTDSYGTKGALQKKTSSYKAQRWLWNESQQLQSRYVKFDLEALIRIAEEAAGSDAVCFNVSKLPEGNFNKAFLVTMRCGLQLVKIPNPNARPRHWTTASEVATMDYVKNKLKLPVPKVLAYCSRASESRLGAEYIVMGKAPGIELGRVWNDLHGRDRAKIVQQLATITARLAEARFAHFGSLYYRKDTPQPQGTEIDDKFSVGPTTARSWFDDQRGNIDINRGPWMTTAEVLNAVVIRELTCLNTFSEFPRDAQQGIFNGPDGYHPTKEAKVAVLRDFLKISSHLLPKRGSLNAAIVWHNDLHSNNIFVDREDPTQITSIIDWQAVSISPMFLATHHPALIEFDGPKLEGFTTPSLPENFEELDAGQKKDAKSLHLSQLLWSLYEIQVQRESPDLLHALRYRETIPCQILSLIGSIFDDAEIYVQSLLADVTDEEIWKKIVGTDDQGNPSVECPLKYSQADLERQKLAYTKWERDVERKARIFEEVGVYTGWNGAVPPDQYDEAARRLEDAKKRFLDRESNTPEEREIWQAAWPFKDGGC